MLDIKYIRQHRAEVEQNIIHRQAKADIDRILLLDSQKTRLVLDLDDKRASLNAASKQKPDAEAMAQLRLQGEEIKVVEGQLRLIDAELAEAMAYVPNISSADMPLGNGEDDNVEVRVWIPESGVVADSHLGQTADLKYRSLLPTSALEDGQRKHHLDIGEALGIIDMKQAAKIAGTRFAYILDGAALLENALVQLLAQKLLNHDFMWVDPPLMVREPVLFGTSHFPEGRDQVYQISTEQLEEERALFLVGSSEPSLFAYGMDRTFQLVQLPLKMFAVTPCFRSEVGSWGKDVRGIKRVHQFTKLEMDVICTPDQSEAVFQELLGYNQWLLEQLALPYRVINKCTGDCGYLATHKQYDVEVWMPSSQEFMETMTDTLATDFQARRLNIKFLSEDGSRQLAHTVNDTGGALGRLVAAILDNYQQADGSVVVPEVLRQWVGRDRLVANKLAPLAMNG